MIDLTEVITYLKQTGSITTQKLNTFGISPAVASYLSRTGVLNRLQQGKYELGTVERKSGKDRALEQLKMQQLIHPGEITAKTARKLGIPKPIRNTLIKDGSLQE